MSSPTSEPVPELEAMRERLALAEAARADLLAQCRHLLAVVEDLQRKVRWLEERQRDRGDGAS